MIQQSPISRPLHHSYGYERIDAMLAEAGWVVRDAAVVDLGAGPGPWAAGVALQEFSAETSTTMIS